MTLVVGCGVYLKASSAVAPPLHDSMSYYLKANHVWEALEGRQTAASRPFLERVCDTFGGDFNNRPPGTVLFSYPTGFSPEFRGFYFRTIFFPVLLVIGAFWLLVCQRHQGTGPAWLGAAMAAGLASLPLFYHFEKVPETDIGQSYVWGFMDCALGGMTALAGALLLLSARRRGLVTAAIGALAAAWTLLLKPSGMVVIPLLLWLWVAELCIGNWPISAAWRRDKRLRTYTFRALALIAGILLVVVLACFGSAYLSRENFEWGANSCRLMRAVTAGTPLLTVLSERVHQTLGWHWFAVFLVVFGLSLAGLAWRGIRGRSRREDFRLLAALAMLAAGSGWWIGMAGVAEVRFVYPFILLFLVVTLPDLVARAGGWPRWTRRAVGFACLCPFLTIVVLLWLPHPFAWMQKLAGVEVNSGCFEPEVRIGDHLVDRAHELNRELEVYVVPLDFSSGVVWGEGAYRKIKSPELPTIRMTGPVDWRRPAAVRIRELINADYLLTTPDRGRAWNENVLRHFQVETEDLEYWMFEAWLGQASEAEGLEVVFDRGRRLLKVVDTAKLKSALERFIDHHRWRDVFYAENERQRPANLKLTDGRALTIAANRLRPQHQVEVLERGDETILRSTGPDPHVCLPPVELSGRKAVLHLTMCSPVKTHLQVFYATPDAPAYDESRVKNAAVAVGENRLKIELPAQPGVIRLRLDPGAEKGDYVIRLLELRGVDGSREP